MEYSHVTSSRDHRRRRGRPLPTPLAERLDGHLATFATHLREGLLAASTAVGLEVLDELMGAEVAALAGPRGRHQPDRAAYRHGSDAGSVTLGGRRLAVRRPRVRSADRTTELALASYAAASATDLLAEGIVARMLAGLSSRRYGAGLEPVGRAIEERAPGTSHAAVSRRFVAATAERLASFLARPLAGQRFIVVMLDGFGMGEHLLLGALGIRADGVKVPLGVVEGSVENQAIVLALLADLRDRGLDASGGLLFVVDADGVLFGAIATSDLAAIAFDTTLDSLVNAADVARTHPAVLTPGADLDTALKSMEAAHEEHVAVVADAAGRFMVGVAHELDVMLAYNRALMRARAEERGEL